MYEAPEEKSRRSLYNCSISTEHHEDANNSTYRSTTYARGETKSSVHEGTKITWETIITDELLNKIYAVDTIPCTNLIFNMFRVLDPEDIRVVIIGQDPYPGHCPVTKIDYACGPSFVIPKNVKTCPMSLKNIFTELKTDLGIKVKTVTLEYIKNSMDNWIRQGVFFTNVSLTMGRCKDYLSNHKNFWMQFTISFLDIISEIGCPIVLLGTDAWELERYVKNNKVLKFYHPVSRNNEFFGCKMFSEINKVLQKPIQWRR